MILSESLFTYVMSDTFITFYTQFTTCLFFNQ